VRTIHIAGGRSGAGKTTLIEAALPALPAWAVIKTSTHTDARHGPPALIVDATVLDRPGSDTARLRSAGAPRTAWLRATPASLDDLIERSRAAFGDLAGVLVEGSAWWRRSPDGPLCVLLPARDGGLKAGIEELALAADLVVITGPAGDAIDPGVRSLAGPGALRADLGDPADPGRARVLDQLLTWARG
jgi:hypothetical protein